MVKAQLQYPYSTEILETIKSHIEEELQSSLSSEFIMVVKEEAVVIIMSQSNISKAHIPQYLFDLLNLLHEDFGMRFIIGIGESCTSLSGIHTSYSQALSCLHEVLYNCSQNIFVYRPERKLTGNIDLYYSKEKELIMGCVSECNKNKALSISDGFFRKAAELPIFAEIIPIFLQ